MMKGESAEQWRAATPATDGLMRAAGQGWAERIEPAWSGIIPYHYAKRHGVLAARQQGDGTVVVLCARAPGLAVLSELRRRLNARMRFVPLAQTDFERVLRQSYDRGQSEATQMVQDLGEEVDLEKLAQDLPQITDLLETTGNAPIVRLINALLSQAIRESASDIHLEAFEKRSVVRFRVDGVLRDIVEPQRALHRALVSRLKVMAQLDIAEKRLPQDGRISLRVGDVPIDVRVSTLPTQHGERVVLRLLEKQGSRLDLAGLGMNDIVRRRFDGLIRTPHGIVLITGPTGSGKTTTLYAGLSRLDRQRLNILTIEDPIEYDLDGVGQTQVHPKINLSFASGLRSILRQDPDVVLVGEIRDFETAEIAIQAGLTGHLVLSTLHTNSAIGAVTRLVDMGVEPFLISSGLLAVLAQRLVRTLCQACREAHLPDGREQELLGINPGDTIYRPAGCGECDDLGFRGRTGIYELIVVDEAVRTMIHDGRSEDQMLALIRERIPSLLGDGCEKVRRGVTSLDEILRVSRET